MSEVKAYLRMLDEAKQFRQGWSHAPTPIPPNATGLWYSEECCDQMLVEYTEKLRGERDRQYEDNVARIAAQAQSEKENSALVDRVRELELLATSALETMEVYKKVSEERIAAAKEAIWHHVYRNHSYAEYCDGCRKSIPFLPKAADSPKDNRTSNSGGEKMRKDKASSPSPTITVINLAEAKELWDSATRYLGHTKGDWVKRELAGYVLNRVKTHLGLRGAEIDMDQAAWQMNELIKEIREEFELPSPPEENTTSNSGQEK